jgi:hypothetical protein
VLATGSRWRRCYCRIQSLGTRSCCPWHAGPIDFSAALAAVLSDPGIDASVFMPVVEQSEVDFQDVLKMLLGAFGNPGRR